MFCVIKSITCIALAETSSIDVVLSRGWTLSTNYQSHYQLLQKITRDVLQIKGREYMKRKQNGCMSNSDSGLFSFHHCTYTSINKLWRHSITFVAFTSDQRWCTPSTTTIPPTWSLIYTSELQVYLLTYT